MGVGTFVHYGLTYKQQQRKNPKGTLTDTVHALCGHSGAKALLTIKAKKVTCPICLLRMQKKPQLIQE